MPRNKTGGKNGKKGKNIPKPNKETIVPEENELYAHVTSVCGSGRFITKATDGIERTSIIRGNMRKKVWVNRLDVVLIEPWEFETNSEVHKASIIHKYSSDEVKKLQKNGDIPPSFDLEETFHLQEDDPFAISDSDDEKDESLDEISGDSDIDLNDI